MRKLIPYPNVFQLAFSNLKQNDPIRMASATAFFAFFALPSIILIFSEVLTLVFGDSLHFVRGQLFRQLAELFSPQSARQIRSISKHLRPDTDDQLATLISIVILLLTSTTLFAVVKNSLNQLWNVRARPQGVLLYGLRDRAVALFIIIVSGLLFTLSVGIGQLLAMPALPADPAMLVEGGIGNGLARLALSVVILATWFAMLFAYLPDIRVQWSAVWVGGFVTSVLFIIGEWVLTQLLTYNQLRTLHGKAGSITLVLLFVFYCSLIFYYGASFTRQYAKWAKLEVLPSARAIGYTITDENGDMPEKQSRQTVRE